MPDIDPIPFIRPRLGESAAQVFEKFKDDFERFAQAIEEGSYDFTHIATRIVQMRSMYKKAFEDALTASEQFTEEFKRAIKNFAESGNLFELAMLEYKNYAQSMVPRIRKIATALSEFFAVPVEENLVLAAKMVASGSASIVENFMAAKQKVEVWARELGIAEGTPAYKELEKGIMADVYKQLLGTKDFKNFAVKNEAAYKRMTEYLKYSYQTEYENLKQNRDYQGLFKQVSEKHSGWIVARLENLSKLIGKPMTIGEMIAREELATKTGGRATKLLWIGIGQTIKSFTDILSIFLRVGSLSGLIMAATYIANFFNTLIRAVNDFRRLGAMAMTFGERGIGDVIYAGYRDAMKYVSAWLYTTDKYMEGYEAVIKGLSQVGIYQKRLSEDSYDYGSRIRKVSKEIALGTFALARFGYSLEEGAKISATYAAVIGKAGLVKNLGNVILMSREAGIRFEELVSKVGDILTLSMKYSADAAYRVQLQTAGLVNEFSELGSKMVMLQGISRLLGMPIAYEYGLIRSMLGAEAVGRGMRGTATPLNLLFESVQKLTGRVLSQFSAPNLTNVIVQAQGEAGQRIVLVMSEFLSKFLSPEVGKKFFWDPKFRKDMMDALKLSGKEQEKRLSELQKEAEKESNKLINDGIDVLRRQTSYLDYLANAVAQIVYMMMGSIFFKSSLPTTGTPFNAPGSPIEVEKRWVR